MTRSFCLFISSPTFIFKFFYFSSSRFKDALFVCLFVTVYCSSMVRIQTDFFFNIHSIKNIRRNNGFIVRYDANWLPYSYGCIRHVANVSYSFIESLIQTYCYLDFRTAKPFSSLKLCNLSRSYTTGQIFKQSEVGLSFKLPLHLHHHTLSIITEPTTYKAVHPEILCKQ